MVIQVDTDVSEKDVTSIFMADVPGSSLIMYIYVNFTFNILALNTAARRVKHPPFPHFNTCSGSLKSWVIYGDVFPTQWSDLLLTQSFQ